jgi:hypothetical protein
MKTLPKILPELFHVDKRGFRKPPMTPRIIPETVSDDGNLK